MYLVFSLLLVAFLFGIWMGLNCYRRMALKQTCDLPGRRFTKTGSRF